MNIKNIRQRIQDLLNELDASDPYAELKKAHAEGKVIQYRDDHMDAWVDCISPIWVNDTDATPNPRYRIKPDEPKPILTPEQIAGGWKEWHGGENPVPGKIVKVMFRYYGEQARRSNEYRWRQRGTADDIIAYRIIEPKLVPIGPEDVPPGSVIRSKDNHWFQVVYVRPHGVNIGSIHRKDPIDWKELQSCWKINRSLSLGKWDATAWEPCSKEASS